SELKVRRERPDDLGLMDVTLVRRVDGRRASLAEGRALTVVAYQGGPQVGVPTLRRRRLAEHERRRPPVRRIGCRGPRRAVQVPRDERGRVVADLPQVVTLEGAAVILEVEVRVRDVEVVP